MLFFQVLLLAGYAYAHWTTTRLKTKFQFYLHAALLIAAVALTPTVPPEWLKPSGSEAPILPILTVLAITIGLPYFLLSSTSPLLQAWYSRVHNAAPPYRLFALSNLASLLALLAYPVAIEPYLPVRNQALVWKIAFGIFSLGCIYTAWRASTAQGEAPVKVEAPELIPAPPSGKDYLIWITLASMPSMLFLAFTSHLVQNVASIPFLWVVPLSMYLLSFVLRGGTSLMSPITRKRSICASGSLVVKGTEILRSLMSTFLLLALRTSHSSDVITSGYGTEISRWRFSAAILVILPS